jgi:hypothetical protein
MDREATDLRRIAGIGTATERMLRASGVRTLDDLADRPTDELAGITGKSPQTVREWQARARELAAAEEPGPIEPDRQRSETFTVEVLLNEDGSVRYVRAEHVYTLARHAQEDRAETASWSDWRSAKRALAEFLEEHTGLAAHAAEGQPATAEPSARRPELEAVTGELTVPPGPVATESASAGHRVRQLATMPSVADTGGVMLSANTPFILRLPVTLAQLGLAREGSLDYQATVVAKRLGQPSRQVVGRATGTAGGDADGGFNVLVQCEGLPAGAYRLEAVLRLDGSDGQVVALLENAFLEVYSDTGRQHASNQPIVVPLR